MSARNYFISQVRGRIESYVGNEKEPFFKLVKYIRTMCKKYAITNQELKEILEHIKAEIVIPFLTPSRGSLYQPKRLDRFENLCRELNINVD